MVVRSENSNCRLCVVSVMDLLERLDEAERLVADSECQIARQKAIISRLVMDDLDAGPARALLLQFKEMHALRNAERDRLRAALATAL